MNVTIVREPVPTIPGLELSELPVRNIPDFEPWDVIGIDTTRTLGIIVCGQAQAGKTTLKDMISDTWNAFDPDGLSLAFANSNGFRGLTYKVIERFGKRPDEVLDKRTYNALLRSFKSSVDVAAIVDDLYIQPLDESLLRSPVVNAARIFDRLLMQLEEDCWVKC